MTKRPIYYKLVDRQPVLLSSPIEWAESQTETERRVAKTTVGNLFVSTVFLGIDHQFGYGPPPSF